MAWPGAAASDLRTVAPWHAKNSSTDGGATTRQRVAPWNEEQGVRGRCGLVLSQLRFARTITTGVCVSDGRLGASGVTMSAIIAGVARPATKMIHSSRCWEVRPAPQRARVSTRATAQWCSRVESVHTPDTVTVAVRSASAGGDSTSKVEALQSLAVSEQQP